MANPQRINDVDTNIQGKTITMPEYQAVSIAAPGATEEATAVFPFFVEGIDTEQQACGWEYPVGTVGGASGRNWKVCASCNRDTASDDYRIIDGKAYCISHNCLEQKLAQKKEGGPLFEYNPLPDSAYIDNTH